MLFPDSISQKWLQHRFSSNTEQQHTLYNIKIPSPQIREHVCFLLPREHDRARSRHWKSGKLPSQRARPRNNPGLNRHHWRRPVRRYTIPSSTIVLPEKERRTKPTDINKVQDYPTTNLIYRSGPSQGDHSRKPLSTRERDPHPTTDQ